MIIIPSLEVLGGKLVRLAGGPGAEPTILGDDPLQTARDMRRVGALFFHVVDLDAVFGSGDNDEVLERLAEDMIPHQVRGGIRTAERADEVLRNGADRIVLGSLPFRDRAAARQLVEEFGMRVAATLDVKQGKVLAGTDTEPLELAEALDILCEVGVQQVIYNSVEFAGEDGPLDLAQLESLVARDDLQVHARCTVHEVGELGPLLELHAHGLLGVILNHALADESAPFEDLVTAV